MKGRKKVPTQLKVLRGSLRKCRENVKGMKEAEPPATLTTKI